MSEKSYSYTHETNDDETGAFVRIEAEVYATTKRSAARKIALAIAAAMPDITREHVEEAIEVAD